MRAGEVRAVVDQHVDGPAVEPSLILLNRREQESAGREIVARLVRTTKSRACRASCTPVYYAREDRRRARTAVGCGNKQVRSDEGPRTRPCTGPPQDRVRGKCLVCA